MNKVSKFTLSLSKDEIQYFKVFNLPALTKKDFFESLYPRLQKILAGEREAPRPVPIDVPQKTTINMRFDLTKKVDAFVYRHKLLGHLDRGLQEFIKREVVNWVEKKHFFLLEIDNPSNCKTHAEHTGKLWPQ
ncbi:hypothetical protein [uncultured Pseudodesulfovibrio sp.]|uniref:hypothetical protein n=1 Tax=uncultured Pseudodesulfovibrio sp. TaxID=2035858 RepID=UPI0029C86FB0|nr:hypothetical protein [uncultured Pseudodesulfovibrio sp.]